MRRSRRAKALTPRARVVHGAQSARNRQPTGTVTDYLIAPRPAFARLASPRALRRAYRAVNTMREKRLSARRARDAIERRRAASYAAMRATAMRRHGRKVRVVENRKDKYRFVVFNYEKIFRGRGC
jgi:hypothetical protein